MKYESNILERLIKTYGVVGNPKYVSEIIKQFIIQGKECYPNLFTYQSDWLAHIDEFGLANDYVVTYTGQHFYAPNTKESSVKRAILKGQTLVNLVTQKSGSFNGTRFLRIPLSRTLNADTKYFVKFNLRESSLTAGVTCRLKIGTNGAVVGGLRSDGIIITDRDGYNYIEFYIENINDVSNGLDAIVDDIMLIEYQNDMENWDIPYFTGMQSVKLPVLTTTGKNLFDKESFYNDWKSKEETYMYKETVDGEEVLKVNNMNLLFADNKGFKISVKKGVPLTMSFKCKKAGTSDTKAVFSVRFSDTAFKDIGKCDSYEWIQSSGTFTPTRDYITVCSAYEKDDYYYVKDIQLEYDTQLTTYEPYKSNILTVNEDVTLRSNGSVCDELDLLTGKLTQRIDEDGEILTQEVVKTVDLNIKDQNNQVVNHLTSFEGGTHFDTSSQTGSVLPTLEVDVVVDLEETLMMCSTEGNTM